MARSYADLQALGAEVIVLGTGEPNAAGGYRRRLNLPYPVLADSEGDDYSQFNVGRWGFGLLSQSAIVVIDARGQVVYERIVRNPAAVLKLDEVKAALWQATADTPLA